MSTTARKISVPALAAAIVVIFYGVLGTFIGAASHVPNAPDFVAAVTFVLTAIFDFVIPEQFQVPPGTVPAA